MALVILTIAAAGILLPFASSAAVQAQGNNLTIAAKLASDRIEKVVSTNFGDIISRYGAISEPKGAIKDGDGNVLNGTMYANFQRRTRSQYVYVSQQDGLDENPNFIRVKVTVYQDELKLAELTRLISK